MHLRSILKKGFDGSENNNVKGFYDKIELVYANVFDNLEYLDQLTCTAKLLASSTVQLA